MLNRFIIISSLLIFTKIVHAQKLTPEHKSLEQLNILANNNIQNCVRDMFKNKVKQPLLQLPIDNNLSIDVFQQTMTLQNQDDFLFVTKRRNMDLSNRFISQGLFYGVQGISNIYTIGLIFIF